MLLAVGYAGMLAVIALTGELGTAPWLVFALAAVAGLFPPPVGPLMRSLWSDLAAEPQQQQCALSLDTVSESTVFAVGPALGAVLIGVWSAPMALAVCAGLVLVGFCALTRTLRRTSSRPHSRLQSATDPDRSNGATGQRPLRRTGFLGLLLLVLGSACALAVEEIAAVPRWGAGTTGALLTLCSAAGSSADYCTGAGSGGPPRPAGCWSWARPGPPPSHCSPRRRCSRSPQRPCSHSGPAWTCC
ncbi:hypothetical protein ACFQ51_51620 [Streptomyces kaempferi]